jgi:hypothetical protein
MSALQPESPKSEATERQEPSNPDLARVGPQSREGAQQEEPFPADLPHYETFEEWDAARQARVAAGAGHVFANLRQWEAAHTAGTQPHEGGPQPEHELEL